ncbi:uncharacterized protein N7484_005219 [Penicillium longicatenatum]|uniref:uncharacterized protein n=1 Tax=Penicillium longicatenatum TaxID=1561947 RepID=UPI002546E1DA|nr:uncharacterized protein N7484_005219 [Penicillium longicatenatum]KAJ5651496.1 hypothetical protein N7484_005219 [Penicillium longicatenatum]
MDLVDRALEATAMDAIDALRVFFLLAAATTITVSVPSSLRSRFLVYGPRAVSNSTPGSEPKTLTSLGLLDYLATWQVPHSYFTQFYVVSALSSVFWAIQLVFRGRVFELIATRISEEHAQQSMSLTQVLICWILLAIQGARRLWESHTFAKPSSSQMWVVHWVLGLGFYLAAGVAIWIEGSSTILSHKLTVDDVKMTNAPTVRTFFCIPLFLMASGLQHDCHHFLFSLKKYTLPDHPIFSAVVCPHYGAECVIYLSLALLAAPPGQMVNKTLLACFAFVTVNLGLTARTTKEWYMQKFGREAVQDRWLMIPWVY